MWKRLVKRGYFVGAGLLLACSIAAAQVRIIGTINGAITDQTGAAVPNAKVVLKDNGTGNVRQTTSNSDGYFSFPDLSFGQFEIIVSAAGFQNEVLPKIFVEAGKTTDVPIQLHVGQQTQTVTVDASASPVLESTSNLTS